MSDLDQLRRELANERGLPEAAAGFLTATTIAGLETQADELAALAGATSPEPEPEPEPLAGLFDRAPAEKQRRQRALIAALHGPAPRARDERGRFAAVSFDGGAREPAPTEPESHDSWLIRVLASRAADAGAAF